MREREHKGGGWGIWIWGPEKEGGCIFEGRCLAPSRPSLLTKYYNKSSLTVVVRISLRCAMTTTTMRASKEREGKE